MQPRSRHRTNTGSRRSHISPSIQSPGRYAETFLRMPLARRGKRWTWQARKLASRHAMTGRPRTAAERIWPNGPHSGLRKFTILRGWPRIFLNLGPMVFRWTNQLASYRNRLSGHRSGNALAPNHANPAQAIAFPQVPWAGPGGVCRKPPSLDGDDLQPAPPLRAQPPAAATLERAESLFQRRRSLEAVTRRIERIENVIAESVALQRRIFQATQRRELGRSTQQVFISPRAPRSVSQAGTEEEREALEIRRPDEMRRQAAGWTGLPPNITQITDHVINQLDRRMMAWRERLGKV
jgi:hypothetical protein